MKYFFRENSTRFKNKFSEKGITNMSKYACFRNQRTSEVYFFKINH